MYTDIIQLHTYYVCMSTCKVYVRVSCIISCIHIIVIIYNGICGNLINSNKQLGPTLFILHGIILWTDAYHNTHFEWRQRFDET